MSRSFAQMVSDLEIPYSLNRIAIETSMTEKIN